MNMNPGWKRAVGFKDNSALESKVVREYKTTKKKIQSRVDNQQ